MYGLNISLTQRGKKNKLRLSAECEDNSVDICVSMQTSQPVWSLILKLIC